MGNMKHRDTTTRRPKKSLGQHWLRSPSVLKKILAAADIGPQDTILEIGPGEGVLTAALMATGAHVVAIEKDERLAAALGQSYGTEKLTLVTSDVLAIEPAALGFAPRRYCIVANIPYYITGAIIKKFLETDVQPERMILLVQKEVAERIARSKKESLVSLGVKAYGTPRYVATVPAGAFYPRPRVDSAILVIEHISRTQFQHRNERMFFGLLHRGFSQKRKLLRRNLGITPERLSACGIAPDARAEDVTLDQWFKLTDTFSPSSSSWDS